MKIKGFVVFAIGILMLSAVSILAAEDPTFKAKCAACHGPDGAGQTTMGKNLHIPNLGSADVQKLTDAELKNIIEKGKGKMPAYGGKLTADQEKGILAFIRSLKK